MSVAYELDIPSVKERVSPDEWEQRVNLAALYRLAAANGWDDMIFTHISARVPGPEHHFLINPYGMFFEEITASSLVKIDIDGNIIDDTEFSINPAGFTIHSAIHDAREDAKCVIHLHTNDGCAVAAQQEGLMPLTQHAMLIREDVAYHDFEGVALDLDERERLVADMGEKGSLLLRNHGTLTVGETCADAWLRMYYLERACTMQVKALAGNATINFPNEGVPEKTAGQGVAAFQGFLGDLAWPGLLRWLDRRDVSYRN